MGISGLLPCLRSITRDVHISVFKGHVVAIDAYSWIHKGCYSCSLELCMGQATTRFVDYVMHRVGLLQHFGVIPWLVFDGAPLPAKKATEAARQSKRQANHEKGVALLRAGDRAGATEYFRRAVDVTPRMAYQVMKVLKAMGIRFTVAPYEADAQLAYLSRNDLVTAVVTEDSDLVAFQAKVILYKMDKFGNAKELRLARLAACEEINLTNFGSDQIVELCVLSGCDYLASLPGLGVKTAHKHLKKYGKAQRVLQMLRSSGVSVPPEYEGEFGCAVRTFLHQKVFDPVTERIVPLAAFPADVDASQMDYLGRDLPEDVVIKVCTGRADPESFEPFEELGKETPCTVKPSPTGTPRSSRSKRALPIQKNVILNYITRPSEAAQKPFKPPFKDSSSSEKVVSPSPPINTNVDSIVATYTDSLHTHSPSPSSSNAVVVSPYFSRSHNKREGTTDVPREQPEDGNGNSSGVSAFLNFMQKRRAPHTIPPAWLSSPNIREGPVLLPSSGLSQLPMGTPKNGDRDEGEPRSVAGLQKEVLATPVEGEREHLPPDSVGSSRKPTYVPQTPSPKRPCPRPPPPSSPPPSSSSALSSENLLDMFAFRPLRKSSIVRGMSFASSDPLSSSSEEKEGPPLSSPSSSDA